MGKVCPMCWKAQKSSGHIILNSCVYFQVMCTTRSSPRAEWITCIISISPKQMDVWWPRHCLDLPSPTPQSLYTHEQELDRRGLLVCISRWGAENRDILKSNLSFFPLPSLKDCQGMKHNISSVENGYLILLSYNKLPEQLFANNHKNAEPHPFICCIDWSMFYK